MCDNFTQEEEDDVLVGRDIICWRKSAVNIVHSPGPRIIYDRSGFHHVTPSVPEKSASSAHGPEQVDELAIIPGVSLGVPDELVADVVPGLRSAGLALEYDGGVRHKRVDSVAGDEEVQEPPVVPGPDFGADRIGQSAGGEL